MDNILYIPKPGDKVYFGRSHGEQTLGRVKKVNRSRAKVEQLESRGVYRSHPVGTVWTVPFSLLSKAPDDAAASAPAPAPVSPERSAMQAEIDRLRAENARLRGETPPPVSRPKREEKAILSDINGVYCRLSPENLSCDGELPRSAVARKSRALHAQLGELFRELGRRVSEDEAFRAVHPELEG